MIRDRVRDKIVEKLTTHGAPVSAEDVADDVLSIPELAVVNRDAEFPRIQKWPHSAEYELGHLHATYSMRNSGWVQEV